MFLLNLFLISADSSGAMPFGTLLSVVFLWFLIDAPLTVVGGLFGKKHGVRPNLALSRKVLTYYSGGASPCKGKPDTSTNTSRTQVPATMGTYFGLPEASTDDPSRLHRF